jgi:hypothetical protein
MPDQHFEDFERKKRDLPLVVVPVIVKAVAANSVAGDALDAGDLHQWIIVRRLAVVAKVIVAGRNENLADQHRTAKN